MIKDKEYKNWIVSKYSYENLKNDEILLENVVYKCERKILCKGLLDNCILKGSSQVFEIEKKIDDIKLINLDTNKLLIIVFQDNSSLLLLGTSFEMDLIEELRMDLNIG